MLIYLKDVEFEEIQEQLRLHFGPKLAKDLVITKHTDFCGRRFEQLRALRGTSDTFVFCTYQRDCLRWVLFYILMMYLSDAKDKYFLDKEGYFKKVTFSFLMREGFLSLVSAALNIIWLLLGMWVLRKERKCARRRVIITKKEKNKLRVAYIRVSHAYNLKAGGALGHTIGVLRALNRTVEYVKVYTVDHIMGMDKEIDEEIIHPRPLMNYVSVFTDIWYSVYLVRCIKHDFANRRYDVIYQRYNRGNFSGVILKRIFSVPLVLEFNSSSVWQLSGQDNSLVRGLAIHILRKVETLNIEAADRIVCVSDVLRQQLVNQGCPADKIIVNPNGVDPRKFRPQSSKVKKRIRDEIGIEQRTTVFGFCGTFGFWHGMETLTEAIIKFNNDSNISTTHFLFIGDGQYRKYMMERLGHYSNVSFTGLVPYNNVQEYLSICNVLISPQVSCNGEPFIGSPTKLFEYMAIGGIIIASRLDQIAEVLSPSVDAADLNNTNQTVDCASKVGVLFEPNDVQQLVSAMEWVLENLDYLSMLGKNARKKALKHYTWAANVERVLNSMVSGDIH